jgi:hypothetical protein
MSGPTDDPSETAGESTAPIDQSTARMDLGQDGAPASEPESHEVKQSALVGYMSVPVHRRFPIRRSTLLMAVAFLGFGTLLYFNPPQSTSGAVVSTPNGDYYVPGATKIDDTTTTTRPTTTTTPTRSSTTTTTTARTGISSTTTTTGQPSTITTPTSTTPPTSSTTTTLGASSGSTTTTSTVGVSGAGTTTAP